MNSKKKRRGQMSEAFCTAMFLSLSGGLQDVYTYLFRGKVFANAQTGNIVLMAVHAFAGEWGRVLHYLVPLCFFALGVFAAELMHQKLQNLQRLHWRQLVVLCEIVMLFVVGFFPQEWNLMANALVSFACAMQVQTFRKVNGYAFASTMCIGNMRSGMDSLCSWVCHSGQLAREQVVAGVAIGDLMDLILLADALDILLQNHFHDSIPHFSPENRCSLMVIV